MNDTFSDHSDYSDDSRKNKKQRNKFANKEAEVKV